MTVAADHAADVAPLLLASVESAGFQACSMDAVVSGGPHDHASRRRQSWQDAALLYLPTVASLAAIRLQTSIGGLLAAGFIKTDAAPAR